MLPGHLLQVIDHFSIDCVIDVGAHHGEFARMLRDAGYSGPIVSFEPVEEAYAVLTQTAADDPAWTTHKLALGAEEGERAIRVSRSTDFSSFRSLTRYGEDLPWSTEVVREERVTVVPLEQVFDSVLPSRRTSRPLLKSDTQGWDLEVLRGAGQSLQRVGAVQVEMSVKAIYEGAPGFGDTMMFLTEQGFELTGIFAYGTDSSCRLNEFDCVLARNQPARALEAAEARLQPRASSGRDQRR